MISFISFLFLIDIKSTLCVVSELLNGSKPQDSPLLIKMDQSPEGDQSPSNYPKPVIRFLAKKLIRGTVCNSQRQVQVFGVVICQFYCQTRSFFSSPRSKGFSSSSSTSSIPLVLWKNTRAKKSWRALVPPLEAALFLLSTATHCALRHDFCTIWTNLASVFVDKP